MKKKVFGIVIIVAVILYVFQFKKMNEIQRSDFSISNSNVENKREIMLEVAEPQKNLEQIEKKIEQQQELLEKYTNVEKELHAGIKDLKNLNKEISSYFPDSAPESLLAEFEALKMDLIKRHENLMSIAQAIVVDNGRNL